MLYNNCGDVMFKNNKILILGFARSGYEAAKLLAKRGNDIYLNDRSTLDKIDRDKYNELVDLGVHFVLGSHPDDLLDSSFDYLIKNPGVPIDHKYVLKARELVVEVINEVEMAYRLLPKGVKIVSITGTNGKTTTTTLTYNILKNAYGDSVVLAGNIGYPLSSVLDKLTDGSILVMEVSCQQLENMSTFHPNIAALTNLSPAHIDFLKSYDNYKYVKSKLFANQNSNDVAILNNDNEDVCNLSNNFNACKKFFSSSRTIDGCFLNGREIYYYEEKIMSIDDILIAGMHNVENCMVAIMIAKQLNVPNNVIFDTISKFKGVEHRLEYVDTVLGRKFYNDTEATNIKCTQIALRSFDKPTVLFLGGLERGQVFDDLSEYVSNVKSIIAIGECRERVVEFGSKMNIPTYSYEHLKDGFNKCIEISETDDIILLSPASASWDQYKECEERGAEFKKLVHDLANKD